MPRTVKRLLGAGMLAAAAYAVWRAFEARRSESNVSWQPQPFPYPPVPRTTDTDPAPVGERVDGEVTPVRTDDDGGGDADARDAEVSAWVDPVDGACPATHPVKGKLSSGIFHVPGGANYERTRPDRCYVGPADAEADGLRAAKA